MSYPHAVRQHCAVVLTSGRVRARFEPPTSTSSTALAGLYPYARPPPSQPASHHAIARCCPTTVHENGSCCAQSETRHGTATAHGRDTMVSASRHDSDRNRARIVSCSCLWCAPCCVRNVTHTVHTFVRFETRQCLIFVFLGDVMEQPFGQESMQQATGILRTIEQNMLG